ncbi:GNAT family N-acetyltransferase [Candidatus Gracilibacteria bacterium]|nr:GNAT family N-acetyltransferase [Candidatus Gracilibacteria bacterium]NJM88510.1 GNAT family N-acetyltransferase [Hydrococcus sp. RU_2_2]NJP21471.1 GNAT family N-acetyltransferase [Hydrococcus sp. CRU_1_1]
MKANNCVIREATFQEVSIIAEHFYQLWRDNEVPPESIKPNYQEITLQFIKNASQKLHFKAYFAEIEGKIIGSASCQLYEGLYPHILTENYRKYGYIWGVYVEKAYRGRGIGNQLTTSAIAHLKTYDCTKIILNASPSGKPIYTSLGFTESNEMWLDLQ